MKELFERHRAQLTPEEDQKIWSRVEQKLSERRSFWQSWRLPVSMAATASAVLMVFVLTRGPQELRSVRVTPVEPNFPYMSPPPRAFRESRACKGHDSWSVSASHSSISGARTTQDRTEADIGERIQLLR